MKNKILSIVVLMIFAAILGMLNSNASASDVSDLQALIGVYEGEWSVQRGSQEGFLRLTIEKYQGEITAFILQRTPYRDRVFTNGELKIKGSKLFIEMTATDAGQRRFYELDIVREGNELFLTGTFEFVTATSAGNGTMKVKKIK